jgi:hypothetical protein
LHEKLKVKIDFFMCFIFIVKISFVVSLLEMFSSNKIYIGELTPSFWRKAMSNIFSLTQGIILLFFTAESDILGAKNDKVLFIQFLMFYAE